MIEGISYLCSEIAEAVNGKMKGNDEKIEAITLNSKEISQAPSCFFAINGKNINGAEYINEAISNGAKLIITQEQIDCAVTVIYVDNVVMALGLLAKKHKGNTKIIAITGSNGKSTTKDMVISVLKTKYSVCGTYKNNNNEIGVALTLLSIKNEDFCVVEMGMRALGEIEWLSYIAEPGIGIITNCLSAHLGKLGSRKNIFKAKTELLKYVKEYSILPNEIRFKRIKGLRSKKLYTDLKIRNIRRQDGSIIFDVYDCKDIKIKSIYNHDILNAVFAYMVGKLVGLDDYSIKKGLNDFKKENSRGEILKSKRFLIINDCYNASYESMKMAIISTKEQFANKKIAVLLGDMLELGNKSKQLHLKIGKLCKKLKIDRLYAYGSYARYYINGFGRGRELKNSNSIAEKILNELDESYVLLVKASHLMNFEKIIEQMREN